MITILSNRHFYHQLTKKYVTLFGNIFNDITLVRYHRGTEEEIERIKVPIIYGPKEKWVTRLNADETLAKQTQVVLPAMTFEIVGMRYVPEKKKMTTLRHVKANTTTAFASQYVEVPYDLSFQLSIYARHIDDANQIMEQILPYFTPDYTVTATLIGDVDQKRDIAIVLNDVNQEIDYEGDQDSIRSVFTTLQFTLKGYYYGPVVTSGLIRHVIANIYNDPELRSGYITKVNVNDGNNGDYPENSLVYQGNSEITATATAKVIKWDKTNEVLHLGGTQGNFKVNNTIRSIETNAAYNLITFDVTPTKLANVSVSPDPVTAEPSDDYGYTTIITEYPDTLE